MKYLINGRQTIHGKTHADQIGYLEAAKAWVKNQKAAGIVEVAYSFPDGGGLFILDAPNHDELMRSLLTFPMAPISEFDIKPMLDFENSANIAISALKPFA